MQKNSICEEIVTKTRNINSLKQALEVAALGMHAPYYQNMENGIVHAKEEIENLEHEIAKLTKLEGGVA